MSTSAPSRPRLTMSRSHRLGYAAVLGLETYSRTHVPRRLYNLLKLRASLVNGCHYCITMHTKALRDHGEPQATIDALADWESSTAFDARERAVLALTDAVTRLEVHGVPDDVWDAAAQRFTEAQLGDLVLAIATINVWNRLAISTRMDA